MPNNTKKNEPQFDSRWIAEMLRVTVFSVPGFHFSDDTWEALVGRPPEETRTKTSPYETNSQGAYEKGKLVFSVKNERADWLYIPKGIPNEIGFQSIGKLNSVLEDFLSKTRNWIRSEIDVKRIAVAGVFLHPLRDMKAVNGELGERIPEIEMPDAHNVGDFSLQINYFEDASSTKNVGFAINNIVNWSGIEISTLRVTQHGSVSEVLESESRCALRLELDINSDASYTKKMSNSRKRIVFDALSERLKSRLQ